MLSIYTEGAEHEGSQTPSRSVDGERQELPWEEREEEYIRSLAAKAHAAALSHSALALTAKRLHNGLGLPGMMLPLIAAAINSADLGLTLVPTGLMLLAALLSGASSWLNCGARSLAHEAAAAAYSGVVALVERELAVPKAYRGACDVVLERISSAFATAEAGAPSGL